LPPLLFDIKDTVQTVRSQPSEEIEAAAVPILKLDDTSDEWSVEKAGKVFIVRGARIEQFAGRTDFTNDQAVQRLRDIMRRQGVLHELVRQGIEAGQTIQFGEDDDASFQY
jgi:Obg family GTPase CgtA-like protein